MEKVGVDTKQISAQKILLENEWTIFFAYLLLMAKTQISSIIFWENLQLANLLTVSSDLYLALGGKIELRNYHVSKALQFWLLSTS